MGFIDSYKHLEKLCEEVMSDERKVSAYIDEMKNTPQGSRFVMNWNEDLKKLKHYRWVRNKIVHEPGHTEENMCEPEDALWLDDFYSRIMNQTDPLALYRKAIQIQSASTPKRRVVESTYSYPVQSHYKRNRTSGKPAGCAVLCAILLINFLAISLIIYLVQNYFV